MAVEFTGNRNRTAISRHEHGTVLGEYDESVRRHRHAFGERIIESVEAVVGQLESEVGRVVVEFDELRARHHRMIHDFVNDNMVLWLFDSARVLN